MVNLWNPRECCFNLVVFFSLKVLLRRKAAEELKREQERKAEERKRIIRERTGHPKHEDARNEGNCDRIRSTVERSILDGEGKGKKNYTSSLTILGLSSFHSGPN